MYADGTWFMKNPLWVQSFPVSIPINYTLGGGANQMMALITEQGSKLPDQLLSDRHEKALHISGKLSPVNKINCSM